MGRRKRPLEDVSSNRALAPAAKKVSTGAANGKENHMPMQRMVATVGDLRRDAALAAAMGAVDSVKENNAPKTKTAKGKRRGKKADELPAAKVSGNGAREVSGEYADQCA